MDTKDKLTAMYLSYTGYALFVVIGLYCVYLSWTTNGRYGTGLVMKIVYAVCAYFANVAYLIFYFVFYVLGHRNTWSDDGAEYTHVPLSPTAAQLNRISTTGSF